MTKQIVPLIITLLALSCTNSEENLGRSKRDVIDTVISSTTPSSTPFNLINKDREMVEKADTFSIPMSVSQFRGLNLQHQLAENKIFSKKDSLFESSYVPGDSVLWVYYRYGKSEVIRLEDFSLLSISIKNDELLEGFFIQLGMSYLEFKSLFTNLDSSYNIDYNNENQLKNGGSGHVWFKEGNMDDPVGWTFGFLNDSLYYVHFTIYYEF